MYNRKKSKKASNINRSSFFLPMSMFSTFFSIQKMPCITCTHNYSIFNIICLLIPSPSKIISLIICYCITPLCFYRICISFCIFIYYMKFTFFKLKILLEFVFAISSFPNIPIAPISVIMLTPARIKISIFDVFILHL